MKTRPIPVLLLLPLLLALSACGNKGPLVLPDEAEADIDVIDAPARDIEPMPDDDAGEDAIGDDPLDRGRG